MLLLGGDFRQLLPVVPGAHEPEIVANTILHHYSLHEGYMVRFSLTANMRLLHGGGGEDTPHRDWLLQLGSGLLPRNTDLHPLAVELPEHLCMPPGSEAENFIQWIYPDVRAHVQQCLTTGDTEEHDVWFRHRAILSARNDVALEINNLILDMYRTSRVELGLRCRRGIGGCRQLSCGVLEQFDALRLAAS